MGIDMPTKIIKGRAIPNLQISIHFLIITKNLTWDASIYSQDLCPDHSAVQNFYDKIHTPGLTEKSPAKAGVLPCFCRGLMSYLCNVIPNSDQAL